MVIYKNYLYLLKRKIFIFKSLKKSSGLRTRRTKVRLFKKIIYICKAMPEQEIKFVIYIMMYCYYVVIGLYIL